MQEAKESSDDGLFFKSGLFTWNKMEMLTVTDASFGNESNFRSQKGRMIFLTGPDSFDDNGMGVHVIGYSSTIIGRVCRSTLQAETYALSDGVEESMRLRAALADAHGVFLRTDWEFQAALSCVTYGLLIVTLSTTIFVIQRLRNAATRDSVSIWVRCAFWSGSLLMESYEKKSDQISPIW